MYPPFIPGLQDAYPHARPVKNRPFAGGPRLRCATGREYWVDETFKLSYEYHDAKDAYVAILEFRALESLQFTLSCPYYDLYGCYVDEGSLAIRSENHPKKPPFALNEEEYAFVYGAKGDYQVKLPAGTTLIYIWAVNKRWPRRYVDAPELTAISSLLFVLHGQPGICHSSRALPLHTDVRDEWELLGRMPIYRPLTMDNKVYERVIELVYLGIAALLESRKDKHVSLKLVRELRAALLKQVREGISPRVNELAESRNLSGTYLRRIHKKLYGITIKAFITKIRMKKAYDLLVKGKLSITEVAYETGYSSLKDFDEQFLSYFGSRPGDVRKKK